jgi:hypothetical protein
MGQPGREGGVAIFLFAAYALGKIKVEGGVMDLVKFLGLFQG